jgi:DNA-binding transcriptional regulator YiaG
MSPSEYKAAREALGWTHRNISQAVGISLREVYRWQAGKMPLEGPAARLLRLLVLLHLTLPPQKFNELVEEVRRK